MPAYSVTINGRNFLTDIEGEQKKLGFFTAREVEAHDPEAAEAAAVRSVRDNERLRATIRNTPEDPPMLFVEEIVKIDAVQADKPVPGFAFYDDEEPAS